MKEDDQRGVETAAKEASNNGTNLIDKSLRYLKTIFKSFFINH
jgi:hypothetical protein